MLRIILASHGHLAQSMKESVNLIMGNTAAIDTVCAYCDNAAPLEEQIDRAFTACDSEDRIVVVTDIFGGSVNNEFMRRLPSGRFHLIAGMNMPLVITLLTMEQQADPGTMIGEALQQAKESMTYCNPLLQEAAWEEDF